MGGTGRIRVLVALATVAGLAALPAAAATGSSSSAPAALSHISGIVSPTPFAGAGVLPQLPAAPAASATPDASIGRLTYHGGPVMRRNTTYAIYWLPSGYTMASGYQSLLSQYLGDVAAASGASDNVYATDTEYYDTTGPIAYASTFANSYVAADPIPNDCGTQYAGTGFSPTACFTDADLQAEISRVLARTGWQPGPTSEFMVFSPRNVGSCFDSSSGSCSYTYYCAYHGNYYSGGTDVIYANLPYPDTSGIGPNHYCDVNNFPNNNWADATINYLSHEHNESITDPNGDAWWDDANGYEDGDLCAWTFGTALGSTSTGRYNQIINGHDYYLQQEYSGVTDSCVLGYGTTPPPPPAPTVSGFLPASATVGTSIAISGSNLTGASSVTFNGVSASFTVSGASSITATVPTTATSGAISVTTPGGTASSSSSFTVLPSISGFSPASGPIGTSVSISGGGLSGTSSVLFNGTAATSITVNSATSVTATVPTGATNGPITVHTPAGTATSTTSFVVTTAPADFGLSASPSSETVSRGQAATYTVTISPINGFAGSVQLTAAGIPGGGSSASFSPNPAKTTSTLTIATSRNGNARGTRTITITGASGGVQHTTTATLTVH
jgi:hypothetical protein